MFDMEDLGFSNMDFNSMPRVRGSLEMTDSTAHAMARLECGFLAKKFKLFIRTACEL
jgi:hypothetical protein